MTTAADASLGVGVSDADTADMGVPGMAGRELYAKFLAFVSSRYGGRFPAITSVEPFLVIVMEFIESVAAGEPGPRKKEIVLRLVRLAVAEHVTPAERRDELLKFVDDHGALVVDMLVSAAKGRYRIQERLGGVWGRVVSCFGPCCGCCKCCRK
jgi:hypothetical protein